MVRRSGLTLASLQVSLKFSSLQELPAEKTTLSLKAHPGSLCSVRAIDQSVLLLQSEEELSVNSVRFAALAMRLTIQTPPDRLLLRSGVPGAALPEAVRIQLRRRRQRAISMSPIAGAGLRGRRPLEALILLRTSGSEGRRLQHL